MRPTDENAFTAAVNPDTASAALRPVNLVSVRASLVLFRTSSIVSPCLENSKAASAARGASASKAMGAAKAAHAAAGKAASAATPNDCAVFLATSNRPCPNLCKDAFDTSSTTLTSAKVFSNLTVSATRFLNASDIPFIIPTEAPKAITRALEASRDLVNSLADPVIRPRG